MKKQWILLSLVVLLAIPAWAKQYPDSIQEASRAERRIEYGWNFEFYGGLGLGRSEYKQIGDSYTPAHVDNQLGFPAWDAGLSINYYFVPWMGLGVGVEFNTYANTAAVTRGWEVTRQDYQNDTYTLRSTPNNIKETQRLSMLEVPIALRFRAMPGKVGFTGSVGFKLGFPMLYKYSLQGQGSLQNTVEYPHWNLTIEDVPGVIEDAPMTAKSGRTGSFRPYSYGLFAEAGMLFQLSQRVDLAVAFYANYYVNDVMYWHTATRELSFADNFVPGEYPAPFTGYYDGILETNEVKELHPWSVGLKIGVQINANRTRAQREYDREQRRLRKQKPEVVIEEEPEPEPIEVVEDTTPVVDYWALGRAAALEQIRQLADSFNIDLCKEFCVPETIFVRDTIVLRDTMVLRETQPAPEPVLPPAKQLDEMLSSAVIFFNLDDTVPILEPADILDRIAEVLRRHPEQLIQVNGHACKLGKPAYNKRLALRRAQAVAARLRGLGVKDNQMSVSSLGAETPFRYNGSHTLSKDRRVEILPLNIEEEFDAISGGEDASATAAPTAAPKAAEPALTKTPVKGTTEVVAQGTRLAQIARRHYGETQYWVFIYEANRDKLSNPSDLPVGMELVIPDLSERLKGMTKEQALEEAARLKESLR